MTNLVAFVFPEIQGKIPNYIFVNGNREIGYDQDQILRIFISILLNESNLIITREVLLKKIIYKYEE